MRLQLVLLLVAPFILVALYHHFAYATRRPHSVAGRLHSSSSRVPKPFRASSATAGIQEEAEGFEHPIAVGATHEPLKEHGAHKASIDLTHDSGDLHPDVVDAAADKKHKAMIDTAATAEVNAGALQGKEKHDAARVVQTSAPDSSAPARTKFTEKPSITSDIASTYPNPTLSPKRLLDGSENYLPVPDAESASPSDLRWRDAIPDACKPPEGAADAPTDSPAPTLPAGCTCPSGRRPFHTILTAQASTYQRWQTLIFYHHFKKYAPLPSRRSTPMLAARMLMLSADGAVATIRAPCQESACVRVRL